MTLILPIIVVAVICGLTVKRNSGSLWLAMAVWICLVSAYYYIKN